MSTYCPANPATGQTWTQYLAAYATGLLTSAPWDGIFYDVVNASQANTSNGQVDANNDNTADGGDGPSGSGWVAGETSLIGSTRSLAPSTLLLTNGGYYSGINGEELEYFPYWLGDGTWSSGYATYMGLAGPRRQWAGEHRQSGYEQHGHAELADHAFRAGHGADGQRLLLVRLWAGRPWASVVVRRVRRRSGEQSERGGHGHAEQSGAGGGDGGAFQGRRRGASAGQPGLR